MKSYIKDEKGAFMIMFAAIIFPIVFLCLFTTDLLQLKTIQNKLQKKNDLIAEINIIDSENISQNNYASDKNIKTNIRQNSEGSNVVNTVTNATYQGTFYKKPIKVQSTYQERIPTVYDKPKKHNVYILIDASASLSGSLIFVNELFPAFDGLNRYFDKKPEDTWEQWLETKNKDFITVYISNSLSSGDFAQHLKIDDFVNDHHDHEELNQKFTPKNASYQNIEKEYNIVKDNIRKKDDLVIANTYADEWKKMEQCTIVTPFIKHHNPHLRDIQLLKPKTSTSTSTINWNRKREQHEDQIQKYTPDFLGKGKNIFSSIEYRFFLSKQGLSGSSKEMYFLIIECPKDFTDITKNKDALLTGNLISNTSGAIISAIKKFLLNKTKLEQNNIQNITLIQFESFVRSSFKIQTNSQKKIKRELKKFHHFWIPIGGTSIGVALKNALKLISEKEGETNSILIISDGMSQNSRMKDVKNQEREKNLSVQCRYAHNRNIPISTILSVANQSSLQKETGAYTNTYNGKRFMLPKKIKRKMLRLLGDPKSQIPYMRCGRQTIIATSESKEQIYEGIIKSIKEGQKKTIIKTQ